MIGQNNMGMCFNSTCQKFICINSVDVLRDTFLKEPNATITANRPPTFIGKYSLSNYADVAFASPSPLWTKRRKLTYQLLHAYGEGLTCLEKQILKNLQILKDEVQALAGRNTEPHVVVDNFIWNTVEILVRLLYYMFRLKKKQISKYMLSFNNPFNNLSLYDTRGRKYLEKKIKYINIFLFHL